MNMAKCAWAVLAFLGVLGIGRQAGAQCCAGFTQQCAGTKSRWCVQNGAPAGTLPNAFCSYGDLVISTLEMLFDLPAQDQFEFDVEWPPNGIAHTGTDCNGYGDGVTGDAFTSTVDASGHVSGMAPQPGFSGYMLSLHEAINVWTGSISAGWPNDFWADHVSGFPLSMDWHIMQSIGATNGDMNLAADATYMHAAFADPRVAMFDNVFALPSMGYMGFGRVFGFIQHDGVSWDRVATNGANPDERRSEYALAYLSLGAGQSVLPLIQAAGICNDMADTTMGPACSQPGCGGVDMLPAYPCSEANIDSIANAHCAIAANGVPGSDLSSFQSGNYAGVSSGPCGSTCPAECGCDLSTMHCVAPWVAGNGGPDGGTGSSSGGSASGSASSGSASSSGTTGSGSSGSSSAAAGSTSSGGSVSGGSGSSGTTGSSSSSTASSTGGSGSASGGAGSASSGGFAAGGAAGSSSGCGCRVAGTSEPSSLLGGALLSALVALTSARVRGRGGPRPARPRASGTRVVSARRAPGIRR
jgi:hypothetical protein